MSSEKLLFDGADLEVGRKEMDRVERRTSVTPETRSGRGHCHSAIFEISLSYLLLQHKKIQITILKIQSLGVCFSLNVWGFDYARGADCFTYYHLI